MIYAGKRVFHLLFLLATMLSCRVCAIYLFDAKQYFKCPICEILKSTRKPSQNVISYADCISCFNTESSRRETVVQKKQLDTCYILHPKQVHLYSLFGTTQSRKQIVLVTKANEKLYLLFNQLKIGNCC